LHAKRLVFNREEHHRDALAPGDLALVFVAGHTRVRRSRRAQDHVSVLLGDFEDWTSGAPLDVGVKRIDPKGSNTY
jgi:hypothetical protein